jgi:hypothetical protein
MAVHEAIAPLLGTWRGKGRGTLPGVPAFDYAEEIRFEDLGGDIAYFQRAWDPATGQTLHAEAGIWRVSAEGEVVASIAQARRNEISAGTVRDGEVRLIATTTDAAEGVRPVTANRRVYRLLGDGIHYAYDMATGDMATPEQHLAGDLRRVGDPAGSAQSIVK